MWALQDNDRFIFAFTRPSLDNCNMYLGATDLTAPGDLRLGAGTSERVYLGTGLVCGNTP